MAAPSRLQPPGKLPDWMTDFSEDDREASGGGVGTTPDFQLGSAASDSMASSWGLNNRPNEQTSDYWRDSGDLPIGGNTSPVNSAALNGALGRDQDPIQNNSPELGLMGGKLKYADPEVSLKDRLLRGASGSIRGFNTGSTLGNVGVNVAANAVGAGVANRIAGGLQGFASNKPVTKTYTGSESNPEEDALTGALGGSATSSMPTLGAGMMGGGGSLLPTGEAPTPGYGAGGTGTPSTSSALPGQPGAGVLAPPAGTAGLATGQVKPVKGPNNGPADPGFAANPIEGRPQTEGQQAEQTALESILSGGQRYQTDGSNGRLGVAGQGGGYQFAGFDFAQDPSNRDIGKSAKYAFSHFAGQAAAAGVPPPTNKQEAEAWFSQYIKPGFDKLGFTVHKVVGDKAFVSAPEHPEGAWVDFQQNSGGQGAMPLAWMAEMGHGADSDPESIFAVQQALGGGGGEGGGEEFGMGRGVMDSGNASLDGFAKTLIDKLLSGMALEEAVGSESTKRQGISPETLKTVGF
jgi:hypothetical protein